jgi:hypothetical protein
MSAHTPSAGWILEPERKTPVRDAVDVLVVGTGPAGITAAIGAAGAGLKVMAVDRQAFVGGNLTIGIPLVGYLTAQQEPIIGGLAQELIDRLAARRAASPHFPCPLHLSYTLIDPEVVKTVAMQMLVEAGVRVLLQSAFAGVVRDGDGLKGIVIEGKSGREAILAKYFIDCSGDADLAFRAGAPCQKGDSRGLMQPPTLMIRIAGVDIGKLRRTVNENPELYDTDFIPAEFFARNSKFTMVGLRQQLKQGQAAGLSIPTDRTIFTTGLRDDEVWVNMTRVRGTDSTDTMSLSHAEIEARRQVDDICRYLAGYVPGFESSYMVQTAPFLGIRESRRIEGRYMLTEGDILEGRVFDDAVALASYPIDLHHPFDDDCTLKWCPEYYSIPYRCLMPRGPDNLLVAGRCMSATHMAMAATRVMPTCMALGEAAGRAMRMAATQGIAPADVDVAALREELIRHGGILKK